MKNSLRHLLAAVMTTVMLCFAVLPAGAAEAASEPAHSSVSFTLPGTADAFIHAQRSLPIPESETRVTAVQRLSEDDVETISGRLCDHSKIYLVELQDGRRTYYIAVDFRDKDAVYFSRLVVMRATSHKLYERSLAMAEAEDEPKPFFENPQHPRLKDFLSKVL